MKRKWKIAVTLMLIGALLAGCGAKSTDSGSTEKEITSGTTGTAANDTLTIGSYADPVSLDSAFAYDFTTNPIVIQITEGLLYYDAEDQLQPGLVESWEEVDETTYVYNVRNNVTFSDGTPMTMDDVLFSIEHYRDPAVASYVAWMYDSVESIEKTGDWQFTVKLKQADALWKHTFATTGGHVHSKAYIEAHPDNYGTAEGGIIGTGPYVLETWDVGSQITLKYNENYWNKEAEGTPQIKNIVVQNIPVDTTRMMASTSGQIDINLMAPVEMLPDLEKSEHAKLLKFPSAGLQFLAFNCNKAPFNDVNVRKAIAYAVDKQALIDNVIKDFASVSQSIPVAPSLFLFEEATWKEYADNANHYDYNMDTAKELLAESGYPDGFDCKIIVDEKSMSNSVALVFQQAMADLGINAQIEKVSNDEAVSLQFGSGIVDGVRPYDMGIFEWAADFPDPSGILTPLYMSTGAGEGGSNTAAYSNPEVDKLLQQQASSTDPKERTDLMLQAMDIINEEMPYVVYDYPNWLFTVSNRITGGMDLTSMWSWNMFVKNITVQ